MLSHRSGYGRPRTLEELTKHFFPSKPDVSLSSLLLDRILLLSPDQTDDGFIVEICRIMLDQWSRCLQEKYVRAYSLDIIGQS